MGRKRKYTAASLEKGVAAYFKSISRKEPAIAQETYEGSDGAAKKRAVIARDEDGTVIYRKVWIKPPSLAGLCLFLHIHRDTWAEYGKDEKMKPIVQEARMIVEDYWNEQLANDCKGARFALEANMGWGERWTTKQEVVQTNVGATLEEFLKQQEREADA